MSVEQQPPDVTDLPKFGALKEWIEKLEAWSRQIHVEHGTLQAANEQLRIRIAHADEEMSKMRDEQESLESLYELVRDAERGVCTWDEVAQYVRRQTDEH